MRVVIMAAGQCKRWKNYLNIPKQMVMVHGEPLLKRTIRQLKEHGAKDIYLTVREENQYGDLGVKEFVNLDENQYSIDRIYGARELSPAVYLFGDCYYTDTAINTIINDTAEVQFYGRMTPGQIKSSSEIFAVKTNDWLIEKAKELRDLHEQGKVKNSLAQFLLRYISGQPLSPRTRNFSGDVFLHFTPILDETTDFDRPEEYRRFLRLYSKEDLKHTRRPLRFKRTGPIKTYFPLSQLNYDVIHKLLPKIPHDVDLVIGIPRDGIPVAYLISIYRNIPMTDLTSFCAGINYQSGIKHRAERDIDKILLVDDICATGSAMKDALEQIKGHVKGELLTATVYATKRGSQLIDFYGDDLTGARSYEWTHGDAVYLPQTMMDIDGVLCPDWPEGWNGNRDYGTEYENWLRTVPLKLRPKNIGTLITWRREEHREITEEWLERMGISYGNLIMADRTKWNNPSEFKAYHYKRSDARLLIESNLKQAKKIHELTGRPVVCFENNEAFGVEYAK